MSHRQSRNLMQQITLWRSLHKHNMGSRPSLTVVRGSLTVVRGSLTPHRVRPQVSRCRQRRGTKTDRRPPNAASDPEQKPTAGLPMPPATRHKNRPEVFRSSHEPRPQVSRRAAGVFKDGRPFGRCLGEVRDLRRTLSGARVCDPADAWAGYTLFTDDDELGHLGSKLSKSLDIHQIVDSYVVDQESIGQFGLRDIAAPRTDLVA